MSVLERVARVICYEMIDNPAVDPSTQQIERDISWEMDGPKCMRAARAAIEAMAPLNDPIAALDFMRELDRAFDRAWPEYAPAQAQDLARAWPNT